MSDLEQVFISSMEEVVMARNALIPAYAVCFYDWIISLDQEVALIYPAPWNVVKVAYIFCRCYPMVVAPFHLWGIVGNHEKHICESYYRVLYVVAMPSMLASQFILMLRTYAFSGTKKSVLALLSIAYLGLIGGIVWVSTKEIYLSSIFLFVNRSSCVACFAGPDVLITAEQVIKNPVMAPMPTGQPLGMISIFTTSFDFLNMFIVFWTFFTQRGSFGPLGQSFLKQGMIVYFVMTFLNTLTIGTFLSPYLLSHDFSSFSSVAYLLPSTLACRLVLMLRRKASPTQTELGLEHSQMVNEALETAEVDMHFAVTLDACDSLDAQGDAQP